MCALFQRSRLLAKCFCKVTICSSYCPLRHCRFGLPTGVFGELKLNKPLKGEPLHRTQPWLCSFKARGWESVLIFFCVHVGVCSASADYSRVTVLNIWLMIKLRRGQWGGQNLQRITHGVQCATMLHKCESEQWPELLCSHSGCKLLTN